MRAPVGGKEEPAAVGSGEGDVAVQPAMKKGPWTAAEDAILLDYVRKYGEGNWNAVQKNSGLQRCGKSCRLRWANHLRPNLKKGSFSPEEEALILQLHARLGNKWARMAAQNFRVNNTLSFQFPLASVSPTASTLFPNAASAHYLFGNCDLTPPTPSLNSRAYSEKAELPSTQPFAGSDRGKRLKLTPSTRQGNAGLLESLLQESQGDEELFKEGLCFEPLPPSCSKHCLVMNSLCKMGDSLCSNDDFLKFSKRGGGGAESCGPRVINHDISIHLDTIPARTTEAPTAAVTHDWCDGGDSGGDISNRPSPVVGNADLGSEMHQLSSTLSMAHDWAFGSCAWDNLPGIC
ncbi:hypothetical protein HPP92_013713 [Vanilla planifolia]|uniref:Uncharacterized protein n=1 Tax=Vanilla planifolia TaxID=51239 RepID=A0A835QZ26_VANPL|nr:hypothetical protein HPP92_013713 [Vanilla planifolia]